MTRTRRIAASIAQGITTGPLTAESVARVFQRVLGRNYRFVPDVIARLLAPLGPAVRVREYRVQRLRYPEPVATLLANLCVNATPTQVMLECPAALSIGQRWSLKKRYQTPHLTQGSPASPALSNLCAYRLDLRLTGLAKAAGVNYTRYADDLLFSGGDDFARLAERFHHQVLTIAIAEGFEPHLRKTRFMPRSTAQRAAGIIVNEKANTSRKEFEVLKAILYHCATQGPVSQNREGHPEFQAHLAGRIAYIKQVNPARDEKLKSLFQRIDWSENPGIMPGPKS